MKGRPPQPLRLKVPANSLAPAIALTVMALSVAGTVAHPGGNAGTVREPELSTPLIVLGLVVPTLLYIRGTTEVWRRVGVGRGVRRYRVVAFLAGSLMLGVALLSPLDAMSGELFSAHMVQHIALILVAAPLLVLGAPLAPVLWAFPANWRGSFSRFWRTSSMRAARGLIVQPLVVGLGGASVLWLWHTPSLYQAALRDDLLHAVEHLSFLTSALLFWWVVLQAGHRQGRYGAAFLLVFVTMLQSGALGALMTFARTPWYAIHTSSVVSWGLTPLEDQQLAGVIMWVPMGAVYLLAALWIVAAWLRSLERSSPTNGLTSATNEPRPNAGPATAAIARVASGKLP